MHQTKDKAYYWDVDVESIECPISALTVPSEHNRESLELLRKFYGGQRVHKATGGVLYGGDSSEWPARWFDAVSLIQLEIDREDSARHKAGLP